MAEKRDQIETSTAGISELEPKVQEESDEDIFKCPICFDVFNHPKNLPCLHTFCEACLGSYIVSSVQNDLEKKSSQTEPKPKVDFKCPVCRVVVPVSDQNLPLEEWAATFATNHSLLALLDKQKLQRNVKLCDPCQIDSNDVTAKSWCKVCNEALCETCSNYHRKFVATKQHKLFTIVEQGSDDYEITRLEYCETHKDRQLEAFCFDHDQPCCVLCVTINHRKCDRVSSLADAAKNVLEKPEITELKQLFEDMDKLLSKMFEITKLNITNVREEKQNILTRISELRIRINTHLDDIQSKLEQNVRDFEKQHVSELNDTVFDLENRRKQLVHYQKILGTVSANATPVHVFLEMKKLKLKQEEIMVYLKSALENIKLVDCSLKIFPSLEEDIFETDNFGTVGIHRRDISKDIPSICADCPTLGKLLRHTDCMFSTYSTFSVECGTIADAIFLPDTQIAITSYGYKVYFMDDKGTNATSLEFLNSAELFGLEVLSDNEILVARKSAGQLHVVNTLKKTDEKNFKGFGDIKWITRSDNQIISATTSRLIFSDTDGKQTKKINVKGPVENIASFNQNILYTNNKANILYCTRLQGEKVFEYQHPELKAPRGVTTDEYGYIFVAGHESSNIHLVSPKGEHVNIVLTEENGINNPSAICYDKKNRKLLVIHSGNQAIIYQRVWY